MKNLILKYRTNGKRPKTEKWATMRVESTQAAVEFMNANRDTAFLPAFVRTSTRNPQTVAILG